MIVRPFRWIVFLLLTLTGAVSHAGILPWQDTNAKLDPRDAAFAPPIVVPATTGVPWGVPLSGGPIRVLLIAPRFALRDASELAARLEIEIDTVPVWDAANLGRPETYPREIPGTSAEEVIRSLGEKIDKKLDVIIAANFDFGILPPDMFQLIADKVSTGTGLVLVHHRHTTPQFLQAFLEGIEENDASGVVGHGIGEQLTGEWKSGLGFLRSGTVGAGRVIEIDLQGERPSYHCLVPALTNPQVFEDEHFDTYLSLIARATRWASGRDVPVIIERVEATALEGPEADQIPPGLEEIMEANAPPGGALFHPHRLHLRAPADRNYTVRSQVRQPGRGQPPIMNTWKNELLKKGAQSYDFYVVAGAGEYWLDIWLLDRDKVVEWYTTVVEVKAWPNISDLLIQKTVVQPQDSVGLSFTMTARKRACIALARATDVEGRIVAETHQVIEPETAYVQIGLKFADLIHSFLKVEVFVSDRNTPVMPEWDTRLCAYAHRYVSVRTLPQSSGLDVITDVSGSVEYGAGLHYGLLARMGVTVGAVPAFDKSLLVLSRRGLGLLPRVTSYAPGGVTDGSVRVPSFSDPAFIADEQQRLNAVAQSIRDFAATAYSLGDSNALAAGTEDVCRSGASVSAFGEYLHKKYGDLTALNAAWGAQYETWDGLAPATLEEARAAKSYARWVDFRLFMDSVYMNTLSAGRSVVRTVDLRARVGMRPLQSDRIYSGNDWGALASRLEMLAVPSDAYTLGRVRQARPIQALTAVSLPQTALTADDLRWMPWFSLFHGAHAVWWPDTLGSATAVPAGVTIGPMGDSVAYAPEFFAETEAIRAGPGALLLRATPVASGIALYTSRASAWLNEVDTQFDTTTLEAERAFHDVIRNAGYTVDFVSPEQVAAGKLSAYRVLVLPMARAMSEAEIAQIEAFHASGGTVIADIAPGTFDANGAARAVPPFDALFGAQRKSSAASNRTFSPLVELSVGEAKASAEFTEIVVDTGVAPAGASIGGIAGTAPLWLSHKGSAGRGVLLNHTVARGALMPATGLIDAFLFEAGAIKLVDVETRKARPFEGERFSYTFGNAMIVGLLADAHAEQETQKVTLRFSRDSQVVDLRTRIAEMRPGNVESELGRGAAAVYAVLPYEVQQCVLTVPPTCMVGTRLPISVGFEIDKGTIGDHLVQIEVYALRTEGIVPLRHYTTHIVCTNGNGTGFIPFALNERLGSYRIVARDVLTGLYGESIVSLAKAQRI